MDTQKFRRRAAPVLPKFVSLKIEFLNSRKESNPSPKTISWYEDNLDMFYGWMQKESLTLSQIEEKHLKIYLYYLREEYWNKQKKATGLSIPSVNGHIRTLKAFYSFLAKEHRMKHVARDLHQIPVDADNEVWPYQKEEVQKLFSQPDRRSFTGLRDYSLMLLLLDSGIRISEALGLHLGDIDIKNGTLFVIGKGNKKRAAFFSRETAQELDAYIKTYLYDALDRDYLFCNIEGKKLQYKTVQQAIMRYGNRSGVQKATAHRFRHTYCVWYLDNGGALSTLKEDVGHQSIKTTDGYTKFTTTQRKSKHDQFSPVKSLFKK